MAKSKEGKDPKKPSRKKKATKRKPAKKKAASKPKAARRKPADKDKRKTSLKDTVPAPKEKEPEAQLPEEQEVQPPIEMSEEMDGSVEEVRLPDLKDDPTETDERAAEPPIDHTDEELHLPERIGRIEPQSETEDEEIQKELAEIYFDQEDEAEEDLEDMSRLKRAPRNTIKKILVWLIGLTTLSTAVLLAMLLIFGRGGSQFTGEQVLLSIDRPEQVRSGELQDYAVRYSNESDIPLGTATLELRLPEGFLLRSSSPELEDGNTFRIGSLPPWGEGEIEFSGILLSPLDREVDLQAVITYRPANFSSEFQKVSTQGLTVDGSTFEITSDGPEQVLPGDRVELTIDYRNGSELNLDNLALHLIYPSEFIPESADPAADDNSITTWRLGKIEPFGNGTVSVRGTFASEAHGQLSVRAELGYIDPRNDSLVVQAEEETVIEVLQGELVAAMVLNGQSEDQAVRLGDDLRFSISYRNTGESSLGNVKISAELETLPEAQLIDWNELEDEAEGQLENGRIAWTSKQIPSLSRLEPNEEGVIEFSVPLTEEPPTEDGNWSVTGWIESEINSVDGDVVKRVTRSSPLVARIMSDTELAATARFYDDEGVPVGSGLLPPQVGQPTTYRLSWNLTNTFHDLADLSLTASLPENVNWTGSSNAEAGELSYDSAERRLTWQLNWLPKTVNEVSVSFDLTIIPTADQLNKIPTLLDATTLQTTDRDIDHRFTLSQPPLSTELTDDAYGTGKGRVR